MINKITIIFLIIFNLIIFKAFGEDQINFDVSGSTSNIYQVKLMKSFEWNNIYCNCPDSKKWANVHGVVCKHILFVIFKVLKLFKFNNSMSIITVESNAETFLEKRKLHKDFLEVIAVFIDLFNFNEETEFMKLEYVEKYHKELFKNLSA